MSPDPVSAEDRLYYFAYGSNMASQRLSQRLTIIDCLGWATVMAHRVVFHKVGSVDGSGKCGLLVATQDERAHGVLYQIKSDDLGILDGIEGVGQGYQRITIHADLANGRSLPAISYLATRLDTRLRLFHWYKHHVVTGAREHGLPATYLQQIEALPSIDDPDSGRQQLEYAIYDA